MAIATINPATGETLKTFEQLSDRGDRPEAADRGGDVFEVPQDFFC